MKLWPFHHKTKITEMDLLKAIYQVQAQSGSDNRQQQVLIDNLYGAFGDLANLVTTQASELQQRRTYDRPMSGEVSCPSCNHLYDLQRDCHMGMSPSVRIGCNCGCKFTVNRDGIEEECSGCGWVPTQGHSKDCNAGGLVHGHN